jgi:hypothetical protein
MVLFQNAWLSNHKVKGTILIFNLFLVCFYKNIHIMFCVEGFTVCYFYFHFWTGSGCEFVLFLVLKG